MLKRLFKWLRGEDQPLTSVPVIHIRNHDQLSVSEDRCHERARETLRLLNVAVHKKDLFVLDYHDLNTKPFPAEVKHVAELYQQYKGRHAIITHSGDDGELWRVSKRMVNLLIECYGFSTVAVIGYSTNHKQGNAYLYKKIGNLITPTFESSTDKIHEHPQLLLKGKVEK